MTQRLVRRTALARTAELTFVGSCSTIFAAIAFCAALVVWRKLGLG